MKLKCIGGPNHRQIVDLPASYQDITLKAPREPMLIGPVPGAGMVASTRVVTRYTRRILASSDGTRIERVEFLAPHDLSDIEALRAVLAP